MKRRAGFSLIEFMVYTGAGYLLVMLVLWQVWSFHARRLQIAAHYDRLMRVTAAGDLMRHELSHAPSPKAAWLKSDRKELIWQVADGRARGYLFNGTRLIRIEGTYDAVRNEWREKSSSLLLCSVTLLSFLTECTHDSVKAVAVDITMQDGADRHVIHDLILLQNRRIA